MKVKFEFKPQDFWIGAYWERRAHTVRVKVPSSHSEGDGFDWRESELTVWQEAAMEVAH